MRAGETQLLGRRGGRGKSVTRESAAWVVYLMASCKDKTGLEP